MDADKRLTIESYNYTRKDLVFQVFVGGILFFASIFCMFNIFPIELVVFFLIPSVAFLGWAKIKIDGSPESIVIESGIVTLSKGNKILLQCNVNDIEMIDITTHYDEYGCKPSYIVFYLARDKEVSCSFQFFTKRELMELSKLFRVV